MVKREMIGKEETTITGINSQLKRLRGVDKKIKYLERVLERKNSLAPETLIHAYETVSDLYYQKPSTTQDESWKRQIYRVDADWVRKNVKYYKDFDEHKKEWIQKNEETVKQIHKYNPEYIFLTETSSIPSGYLIKEALLKAYPNSPLPKFYRVDPRQVRKVMSGGDSKKKRELEEFFRKRIKNKNANILVYDSDWDDGWSPGSIVALLKHPEKFGFNGDINCPNVKMNGRIFPEHARKLKPDVKKEYGIGDSDIALVIGIESPFFGFSRLTEKGDASNYDFRGRIRKRENYPRGNDRSYDPRYRTPLELIKGAKELGGELGQEIHTELEKKKKLEHIVSGVVSVGGILGSFFFLSSNLTGNAIADLTTKTTSFLGAGLLIVGLVAGFFWVKSRKK